MGNDIICPACQTPFTPPEPALGVPFVCPKCGAVVPVALDIGGLAGLEIAGYRITDKLGEGPTGIVYGAEQLSLKRQVAFKALRAQASDAFHREAVVGARLSHHHIVSVFDIAEISGFAFLVMERVDGVTLRALLRAAPGIPMPRALAIMRHVLLAVSAGHHIHILHGDLKPENVFIMPDGAVKVSDFGLPGLYGAGATGEQAACYLAPEVALTEGHDERSDLYAAGAVLFEMLAGQPPFAGNSWEEIVKHSAGEQVADIRTLNSAAPERLAKLVGAMLARKPEDRPSSVEDVLEEFDLVDQEAGISEREAFASADWNRSYASARAGEVFRVPEALVKVVERRRAWPAVAAAIVAAAGLAAALYAYFALVPRAGTATTQAVVAPISVPVAESSIEKRAKELYDEAAAYAQKNPTEYEEIQLKFRRAADAGQTTPYQQLAMAQVDAFIQIYNTERDRVLTELKTKVDAFVTEKRFSDALAALSIPESQRGLKLDAEIAALRKEIEAKSNDYVAALTKQIRTLVSNDEVDAADALLKTLKGTPFPDARDFLTQLTAEVAARRRDIRHWYAVDAKADCFLLLKESNTLAAHRDYDAATAFIEKQIANPFYATIQPRLQQERDGLTAARDVFQRTVAFITDHPGTELAIRGIPGAVTKVEDGRVFTKGIAKDMDVAVKDIASKEIARIADQALQPQPDVDRKRAIAIFLLYDQQMREAERQLRAASAAGSDVTAYLERLALFTGDELSLQEKAARADRALDHMRTARRQGKWALVIESIGELNKLSDLPLVANAHREIADAMNHATGRLRTP